MLPLHTSAPMHAQASTCSGGLLSQGHALLHCLTAQQHRITQQHRIAHAACHAFTAAPLDRPVAVSNFLLDSGMAQRPSHPRPWKGEPGCEECPSLQGPDKGTLPVYPGLEGDIGHGFGVLVEGHPSEGVRGSPVPPALFCNKPAEARGELEGVLITTNALVPNASII